ncbi:hypothetical protein DYI95_005295 [Thermaerobacter sp. PB12/4term]|uniref:regulatory protein RecX n=1 Tax=Thermaerobacter sp. PB12/4term TaxID=2293838 RepID=UPI000E328882|nr:RecX family transcriptional regulator [Thermaerobacter sp. PB12/4term]QIA27012.1 hypothetical protein DYI95_005295 [Thermaerobacter sp. PB12/4term]
MAGARPVSGGAGEAGDEPAGSAGAGGAARWDRPAGGAGAGGGEGLGLDQALALALRWLGLRARTAREIARRLQERGFPEPVVAAALDRLRGWGYIDDRQLARDQVEGAQVRHIGPLRLRAELLRRGIAPPLADQVLAEGWPEGAELEQARQLARRRWAQLEGSLARRQGAEASLQARDRPGSDARRRAAGRLYRYLLGRGFHAQVAERVVRELLGDLQDGAGGRAGADP